MHGCIFIHVWVLHVCCMYVQYEYVHRRVREYGLTSTIHHTLGYQHAHTIVQTSPQQSRHPPIAVPKPGQDGRVGIYMPLEPLSMHRCVADKRVRTIAGRSYWRSRYVRNGVVGVELGQAGLPANGVGMWVAS